MVDFSALQPYERYFSRNLKEIADDLESYAQLLRQWQKVQNLVSRETLDQVWSRHFADSLQVLRHLGPQDLQFLDLGSGGGFPALPLAIASKGMDRRFILVEPTGRKVSFLRTVARELGLNVTVLGQRIEAIDSRETGRIDVITSRALASLPTLCGWMEPFFTPQTGAILHKGREHVEELAETAARWDYDVVIDRSDTDESGVLLSIKNLRAKSVR